MGSEVIRSHFPEISADQIRQFGQLEALYKNWNEKINLISRKDIDNLMVNHVLHSLGIGKVIAFKPGTTILDVGTGGGFPGIPLAILFPEVKFHLIDSIGKKIKVVQDVVQHVGLKNVVSEQIRAEKIRNKYDFVVSRAVTRIRPFVGWVRDRFNPISNHTMDNGILYLKGGDLDEELAELKRLHQVFELSEYFKAEFFTTKKVVYVPMP